MMVFYCSIDMMMTVSYKLQILLQSKGELPDITTRVSHVHSKNVHMLDSRVFKVVIPATQTDKSYDLLALTVGVDMSGRNFGVTYT
jgi:hypothetical protein